MILRIFCYTISICLTAILANAQVQEDLTPTEKRYQSIVTEPLTVYKGFFRVGVTSGFNVLDKTFNNSSQRRLNDESSNGRVWNISAAVQYGITDRLQGSLRIPYTHTTLTLNSFIEVVSWDSAFTSRNVTKTVGIGDMSAGITYQLIHGNYTRPFLGVTLNTTFPTGRKNPTKVNPDNINDYTRPAGRGVFDVQVGVTYRQIKFPYSWDLGIAYTASSPGKKKFKPSDAEERKFKPGNILVGTASFNVHLNNWIIFKSTVTGGLVGEGNVEGIKGNYAYIVNAIPGLVFQLKGFRLTNSVAFPVAGRNAAANPVFTTGLLYTF